MPYLSELAVEALSGLTSLVTAGPARPVGFFAYPGVPSVLADPATALHVLAGPEEDAVAALEALADALGAPAADPVLAAERPAAADGPLDLEKLTMAVGALVARGRDRGRRVRHRRGVLRRNAPLGAPEHDYLFPPAGRSAGACPRPPAPPSACPDRPVVSLEADGSAMYTIQALWTQAREGLDVTTVIVANRSYAILEFEFSRVRRQGDGAAAHALMDIGRPGARLRRARAGDGRARAPGDRRGRAGRPRCDEAVREPGPHLIEAIV